MQIRIPDIIKCYNSLLTFGEHAAAHRQYEALVKNGSGKAADCLHCGQCEGVCPQHLEIVDTLEKASALLDA